MAQIISDLQKVNPRLKEQLESQEDVTKQIAEVMYKLQEDNSRLEE